MLPIQSYDTIISSESADAMAEFINALPEGTIVLAAIRDTGGSSTMTENAYIALESLGSALAREVGFRDSWAMIGRKGAPIGGVPEILRKWREGPVAIADTLYRFAKRGKMISPEIGPALEWRSVNLNFNS